jgi:hypothetical protein
LLRSGEVPKKRWSVDRGEPYLNVAVPIVVPDDSPDSERFRFELLGSDGAAVWHTEMAAARIREHLESADVVSLAVSPEREIEAGRYQFRVTRIGAPEAPPLYQADIDIDYRQSPAATKAPQ